MKYFSLTGKFLCLIVFPFFSTGLFSSQDFSNDPEFEKIMLENGTKGTIIISSLDGTFTYVHNQQRARERLTPASTFKIANSIIALEMGTVEDQFESMAWDGQERCLEVWNRDHNLKSAFKHSCVWFYQALARKIGSENYLEYLNRLDYGNHLVGNDVTTFWLEGGGDLRISPFEQIDFLKRIFRKELPISDRTYNILEDIMLEEESSEYRLYSKSGAATKNWKGHGWYVGYIKTQNNSVYFFVTNILIDGPQGLSKRKEITLAALRQKGIL